MLSHNNPAGGTLCLSYYIFSYAHLVLNNRDETFGFLLHMLAFHYLILIISLEKFFLVNNLKDVLHRNTVYMDTFMSKLNPRAHEADYYTQWGIVTHCMIVVPVIYHHKEGCCLDSIGLASFHHLITDLFPSKLLSDIFLSIQRSKLKEESNSVLFSQTVS